MDVNEAALVMKQLIEKCRAPPRIPNVQMCGQMTKRKRVAGKNFAYLPQLVCIPSVAEGVAKRIPNHFGSFPALQDALADFDTIPSIRLLEKSYG